jgi:hypothetical protein
MPNIKRAGGVAQGVRPEFKPQYLKKKKNSIPFQLLPLLIFFQTSNGVSKKYLLGRDASPDSSPSLWDNTLAEGRTPDPADPLDEGGFHISH